MFKVSREPKMGLSVIFDYEQILQVRLTPYIYPKIKA